MGFFPDPESQSREFGSEIFLFWARSENLENPEIPGNEIWKSRKNPVNLGVRDWDLKNPKKSGENPGIRDFFGILYVRDNLGIFYPRDRDFYVRWDIPRKSHLC